jgi:hypothetical protein
VAPTIDANHAIAGALRFDEIVEPVGAQQLIQALIKRVACNRRQVGRRDPHRRLSIAFALADRHGRSVVRDVGRVDRSERAVSRLCSPLTKAGVTAQSHSRRRPCFCVTLQRGFTVGIVTAIASAAEVRMIRLCALMFTLLIPSIAFPQSQFPDPYAVLQDDLLDHLVGKWNVAGTTHNTPTAQTLEVDWVLNHQFNVVRVANTHHHRSHFR